VKEGGRYSPSQNANANANMKIQKYEPANIQAIKMLDHLNCWVNHYVQG
jgi:hypothetical protein